MIKEFQYYLDKNLVKIKPRNKEQANSLIKKAIRRFEYVKSQCVNEKTSSFVFENTYESMREAIQSLMSLYGYKPYSHEVLVAFMIKYCSFPKQCIFLFDRYRKLRNKSVYSAKKISILICEDALIFLEKFLLIIKKEFDRKIEKN